MWSTENSALRGSTAYHSIPNYSQLVSLHEHADVLLPKRSEIALPSHIGLALFDESLVFSDWFDCLECYFGLSPSRIGFLSLASVLQR